MKRTRLWVLVIGSVLLLALVISQSVVAQQEPPKPQCDVDAVIAHQEVHAQELANFAKEAKTDLDAALANLYRTAIAYQALAVECGFAQGAAVQAAHELEHSGLFDDDTHTETHVHSEEEEAATLAMARTIGDPENGKILFNTVRPEVSFACATCHRVDSTETLVGPGLLGISGHQHNPAAADPAAHDEHASAATPAPTDSMRGMNMGEATATPEAPLDAHGYGRPQKPHMLDDSTSEAIEAPHDAHDGTSEAAAAPEQTLEQTVEFLHTSITNPSAFVMTGFPDNLMPKVYGTIFTEEEINNLIAYLLTLN